MQNFSHIHTVVLLVWGVGALALCMCAMQPVFAVIAWASTLAFVALARGARAFGRALAWQVPIVLAVAAINALFSQNGATVLFEIAPLVNIAASWGFAAGVVYAEALVYGATMAIVLVTTLQLFAAISDAVDGDEVLAIFGRALPTVALMVSMTLGLVPKMRRRANEIQQVSAANLKHKDAPVKASAARLVSVLLGWSLEDSLQTADTMSARGWGRRDVRQARYSRRRFSAPDGVRLAIVCALLAAAAWAVVAGMSGFAFYPTLPSFTLWWGYVPFAVYFLLPHVVFVAEEAKWMR
jgi:energy-coupling factor transport system permease protein